MTSRIRLSKLRIPRALVALLAILTLLVGFSSAGASAAEVAPEPEPVGEITARAADADGASVAGVTFALTGPRSLKVVDGSPLDESPVDGEVLVTELPLGDYSIEISKVPEGSIAPDSPQKVTLAADALTPSPVNFVVAQEVAAEPEPAPVEPAPEPKPEPAPVEPAPEPKPKPAPVEPAPEPKPEPAPVEPAPEPKPKPAPVEPAPTKEPATKVDDEAAKSAPSTTAVPRQLSVAEMAEMGEDRAAAFQVGEKPARPLAFPTPPPAINPPLVQQCGIDVAIVLDVSGSINAGELIQSKEAAVGLVRSLEGTPSRVGVFSFASRAPATGNSNLAITPVATPTGADRVVSAINGLVGTQSPNQFTNWDEGFDQVPQGVYDAVFFVTDGNPNRIGPGTPAPTQDALNAGVDSSNELKNSGSTIVAFGLGDNLNEENISYISGTQRNEDYYLVDDFADLENRFRQVGLDNCGSTITVVKQVRENDGTLDAAAGWQFDAEGGVTPDVGTTDDTGAVNFDIDPLQNTRDVTFTEIQQQGFTLEPQGGDNAVCTNTVTDEDLPVVNAGPNGWTVSVDQGDAVSCEVINARSFPSIELDKQVEPATGLVAGEEVTYTFTAENTGDVPLDDVTIAETSFSGTGDISALTCDPTQPARLAPADTLVCTATYEVTQADVDAGGVQNVATAAGVGPNEAPVTDDDDAEFTADTTPNIALVKSADPTSDLVTGQEVTYTFTTLNTGAVTLTDVNVTEDSFTGTGDISALDCTPGAPATLAPGDEQICTATYTMTQADVDAGLVNNVATATGTAPDQTDVTDTDDANVVADDTPAIEFQKSVDITSGAEVGTDVVYTFLATNSGGVSLNNVTITEDSFTGTGDALVLTCDPPQPANLAPGAQMECTAPYTLTQADVDAGEVDNVATASGTSPGGQTVQESDVANVTADQTPAIELIKEADPTSGLTVGATVDYTFTATNIGDVTLTDVVITDEAADFTGSGSLEPLVCEPVDQPAILAPGDALVCTTTYVLTQDDVDSGVLTNLASVVGTSPDETTVEDTDDATVAAQQNPEIGVVKTATPDTDLVLGDEVDYTIVGTNTGDVTLTDVTVRELAWSGFGDAPELTCIPEQPAVLAPTETITCTGTYEVQQPDVDAGTLTNVAEITGDGPDDTQVRAEDDAAVTLAQDPGIDLVKTSEPAAELAVGDEVTYTFTTTNVGTVSLVDVTVTETDFTGSGAVSDITCDVPAPIALAPGAVVNCTATYTITQADVDAGFVDNTALAEGFTIGGDPFTDEDDTTVQVDGTPGLDLVKDVAPSSGVAAGDEVTYTFTASNGGRVTLSDVEIDEESFTGTGDLSDLACTPAQPATLAPGDTLVCTATYVLTQADIDSGQVDNVAVATGTTPAGEPVTDEDDATITADDSPVIDLVKTSAPTANVAVGDEVTYTLTATNVGGVTLTNVQITETFFDGSGDLSGLTCDPEQPATLAPGESMVCTATYVITQVDVDAGTVTNVALATGEGPGEDTVTDEDDSVVEAEGDPELDLVKTASPVEDVGAGDEVTYTFTATNTGNVTLSDVAITEVDFDGSGELSELECTPEQPASLAPAAALVCTATYVVTEADVEAGSITNVAAAAGTPPDGGDPVVDEDTVTVPVVKTPVTPEPPIVPETPEPAAPPAPPAPAAPAAAPGPLPKTGSDALPLVLTSLLLLLGGSALVAGSRAGRRNAAKASV